MNRAAIWITSAITLFLASLGAGAYVWHRAEHAPLVVDTRAMLGHPPLTPEQRARSVRALELLEGDVSGPLQRGRAVAVAHTLSAYGSLGGWSVRGTVRPFPDAIASLETELWLRLTRELGPESVRGLESDGFALDAFPFGRAQYEFSMSELGASDRSILVITGPAGTHELRGALRLDATLAAVLHK